MKAWYSASELAAIGPKGIPSTVQRINAKAQREGWRAQVRSDTVGRPKQEYHFDSLPAVTQHALQKAAGLVKRPPMLPVPQSEQHLNKAQRDTITGRLVVVQHVERLMAETGLSSRQIALHVSESFENGTADEELVHYARLGNARNRGLSARTILRWLADSQKGHAALAPRWMPKKGEPAWAGAFLKLYRIYGQTSIAQCVEELARTMPAGAERPSYDQARRYVNKMDIIQRSKGRVGPRQMKNILPHKKRSVDELHPTSIYTSDGHTGDFYVRHPKHGQPFRPEITSIVDVKTRRLVGWSAGLSEQTWGTLDAMRQAFTTAGLCGIWYVDRGKGFNNKHFDDEVTGFLRRLGIEKMNSLPYNSQARGVIERLHQSVWIRGGRTLPAFMGKDMDAEAAQRVFKRINKDIKETGGSRLLMEWSEFLEWGQEQVDRYNERPHRGLEKVRDPATGKARHLSPNEAWAAGVANAPFEIHVVDPDDADLFRPYKRCMVRRGVVTLWGNEYFSETLAPLHGESVLVGYDIHDAGKVWIRAMDNSFICTAEFGGNRTSYAPISMNDRTIAARAKGRLKRIDNKAQEIMAERDSVLIDFKPAANAPLPMPAEQIEALNQKIAMLGQPRQPEAPATINGRPNWSNDGAGDIAYVTWLLANPDQVTEYDYRAVRGILQSAGALSYMRNEGFDIEPIRQFLAGQLILGQQEEAPRHAAGFL